jgi:hypothetical protein
MVNGLVMLRLALRVASVMQVRPARRSALYWDFEAAFVDEDTIVASTTLSDPAGAGRHWIVDARRMTLRDEVVYPFPIAGPARSAGDGVWYTMSEDEAFVHLWQLADE